VAVALRRACDARSTARAAGLVWVPAIVVLPWLNVRYAVVAVVLLAFALAARPPRRVALTLAGSVLLSAIALCLWHDHLYGFFDPRRVYGRRPELTLALVPEGIQGLLFDQEFGLLAYAPVFVLVAPGLFALRRASPRLAAVAAALLLVVILTAGSWPMWRGGFNPPARFLVPILPVLALAVAAAVRRGAGAGTALLMGFGLWTGLAGGWDPRLVHRDREGTATFFRERSGAEEWTRLMPAYVLPEEEADRHRLAWVWAIALGVAATTRRLGAPTARGMGLATAGLAGAALVASNISDRRTEGRDAVRIVGRPALATPGWRVVRSATAEWGPSDLGWGPAYEPHRHPDGAVLGGRLRIPPGRYVLEVAGQDLTPQLPAPDLVTASEPGHAVRLARLERVPGGLAAPFEVFPPDVAVSLRAEGGGPFVVDGLRLRPSTFSGGEGLNDRRERSR